MPSLDVVRQAIRDATLPKIAVPPVLTSQEQAMAQRLAWTLRVPSTQEIAEAMEIPLPEMPEPRVFPVWQPSYPSPTPWWRRRRRERALEAERRGNLVVLSAPEIRPARSIDQIFMDVIAGDRNRQDQQWAMANQRYGVQVESYQIRYLSETFGVPAVVIMPRRRAMTLIDMIFFGNIEAAHCPCATCTEWRAERNQTEEERIEAAGERYRNRTAQDFLDYSGQVLTDYNASAGRWDPEAPEEDTSIEDEILAVLRDTGHEE